MVRQGDSPKLELVKYSLERLVCQSNWSLTPHVNFSSKSLHNQGWTASKRWFWVMCLLPVSRNVITDAIRGAVLMSLAIGGFNCGLIANANLPLIPFSLLFFCFRCDTREAWQLIMGLVCLPRRSTVTGFGEVWHGSKHKFVSGCLMLLMVKRKESWSLNDKTKLPWRDQDANLPQICYMLYNEQKSLFTNRAKLQSTKTIISTIVSFLSALVSF